MTITITGGKMEDQEQQVYVDYIQEKHGRKLESLEITMEGDEVGLRYRFLPIPFERIRRITGYLVGTMDRWNAGKTAEEHDRIKHNLAGL